VEAAMKAIKIKKYFLILMKIIMLSTISFVYSASAFAEDIELPLKRIIATQSVTKLEVISTVKTLMGDGRVLSIKKKSSYSNPDCHHVKALSQNGELQNIKLGCYIETLAHKSTPKS